MNAPQTISQENTGSMKMLQAMVGIGLICALLIVLTYEGTLPRVRYLKEEALQKAIFQVLPGSNESVTFLIDEAGEIIAQPGKNESVNKVYAGYTAEGRLVGVAIEASGKGYADVIKVLYGYDPAAEKVIGFHVLESKETPGLGDKIEKDKSFQENFKKMDVKLGASGLSKEHPIIAVKSGLKQNSWEVDGITGATISSRAVASILEQSTSEWLPLIRKNMDEFKIKQLDE
ncbi:RnfABCDGE type electron transport complex subunit G [Marinoscillum sp. MHG1-6]|uniref:RnfABCDGE type electron transport complex subunit G n=1 Tax=Marinoscillum sp. MHG1-6 TaxID=2959627 RepID=UPI00215775A3|nr:RnfABCDGE type electron transport complex subunit G [Marinoscillum sp. MHG1-6]